MFCGPALRTHEESVLVETHDGQDKRFIANCKKVVRFELWLLEKSHFKQNRIFKK
jgi:hypothetical protein